MYFKKLEVFGFKSFADKTELNFGPGITAIIGPNGCGKSNIFDAVRWVLGEQSVKELRGSSMEDVIFNGTDKKPALGFAEVSLTFSNETRVLPIEYDEVTVTRRLFRSGESEYLLNKTQARLKDIVELFMGTGIGAEAYSLVQQGRVDLVVSAKPEERRMILDEAAGITKYKAKRKEALNKLKSTEYNLLRINDIIIEVKRQISSLERQANKARRYKEELEKLKILEVRMANHDITEISRQRGVFADSRREFADRETQLTAEMDGLNNRIEHELQFLEEIEEKINEINAEAIKLDGQIDINKRQIEFNEERLQNIVVSEQRINTSKQQLMERCRQQQNKIEELKMELEEIARIIKQNHQCAAEKRAHLEVVNSRIKEAQSSIKYEEARILDITSNQVNVKNRLTDIMKDVQGGIARKRRLEMEGSKVQDEKTQVAQKLTDINVNIEANRQRIGALQQEHQRQEESLRRLNDGFDTLEQTIDELEKKKLFLNSQKEFIEKLAVQYRGIPDPVNEGRFITATPPLEHHTGIIGKVKEVKTMDALRAMAFKGQFSGHSGPFYEIACEAKFIELDPQQISAQIAAIEAEIAAKASVRQQVSHQIEDQTKSVKDLQVLIHEREKALSIFEVQKNDIIGETNKLSEEWSLVNSEMQEISVLLVNAKQKEEDLTRQLDSLTQEFNFCQLKIKDQQKNIAERTVEREDVTVSIAQLETEITAEEKKKTSIADNRKLFAETLDSSLDEIKRLEREFEEWQQKRGEYLQQIEILTAKIEAIGEQKVSLQDILGGHERQKEEVSRKINSIRTNLAAHSKDLEQIKNDLHALALKEQQIEFQEKEIRDRLWQSYKIELNVFTEELRKQWLASQNLVLEQESAPAEEVAMQEAVSEQPMEQPSADAEAVVEFVPPVRKKVAEKFLVVNPDEPVDPHALAEETQRLRKRCESFGSVNLVAIDEFEELRERFKFLTKQQSDLITAKESLHATINKINRQTRQMFMDTFIKVSEEFRIYFRMLFGGGQAQLVLLDPENVLESGIEIIAQPPGKKLQSISLLSGGEKSLTAIALIFGVFKVNPSPFCVLDEIDAALDESNVGRFSYLLKDFAKIAQFIVITHNKKTMSAADVMYGVTMQETGISRIVSVKFSADDEEKQRSAAEVPVGV